MEKKSILYIMSIDWKWIYQRPQILAEKLGEDYDVTVIFPRFIWKKISSKDKHSNLFLCPLWKLPFQERCNGLLKISGWINRKVLRDIHKYDYIYAGYPLYARYIPDTYQGKVIYDCMDNYEAMYPLKKSLGKLIALEENLVKKCNLLIVSSAVLRQKMDKIAGYEKSILIRNGMGAGFMLDIKEPCKKEIYDICYIGTISSWFDMEMIKKSLESNQTIRYQLIGPYEEKVTDSRIHYYGALEHSKLSDAVKDYDCLIMPFKLNDIVEAVDPVKLYEYIAFGKCIISVYYPEIDRFSDFVYFYRTEEEYIKLLNELGAKGFPPKYCKEQQEKFLNNNTWEQRYQLLRREIRKMEEKENEN